MTDEIQIRQGGERTPKPARGGLKTDGRPGSEITWDRDELIRILPECRGILTHAAKRVGITPTRIYEYAQNHPEWGAIFQQALAESREQATDDLEKTVLDMAIDGYVETTIEHGRVSKQVRKYDPKLGLQMLERRRPEVYHLPERLELSGAGGGPITIDFNMSDRDLDTVDGDAEEIDDAELEEGDDQ